MRTVYYILAIVLLISCKNKKVRYSGLNDLVVGVQQVVLYKSGEFYLELGVGGVEGKYLLQNDTITLEYNNKPKGWPDQILLKDKYFETLQNKDHQETIRIERKFINHEAAIQIMDKIEEFKKKVKFVEDAKLLYPGIADPKMRPILSKKINKAADDFKQVSLSNNPTDKEYQEKIGVGLKRFLAIYLELDTEDRERVCCYFEELMDIVGLESSDGQLNKFMYGFDLNK